MTSCPSVFTASGTVCAVDSPALTFLPLRQALCWDSGLLPTLPVWRARLPPNLPGCHELSLPRASSAVFEFSRF